MAERLPALAGPIEFLDLSDGESKDLKILTWERGTTIINTVRRGRELEVEIPVLRVHVPEATKPLPPRYYDISSKTLQAQLMPLLLAAGFKEWTYRVTAYGVAPRKRFSLERLPY